MNFNVEKMRKTILTALLAASGVAQAQSSVTLFGIVDANIQRGTGSTSNLTQMGSGGLNASRFGFRGQEDLGGGLWAGFWLESGFLTDTGTGTASNTNNTPSGATAAGPLVFGRRSTVSLGGSWGELRLGRDFSSQYHNRVNYDPFGNNGVGATQAFIGALAGPTTRVSNSATYFAPQNSLGIYGQAQVYRGDQPSSAGATKNDGNGLTARIGWRNGPLDIAIAQGRTKYATTATAGDITSTNIGARYDFSDFSVMGAYFRDKVETTTGLVGKGGHVAGIWRIGVGEVKAMYSYYETTASGNPETKKFTLGYVHNLSKRTALYGTVARVNNSGGATTALNGAVTQANRSSSGMDLGIRHSF